MSESNVGSPQEDGATILSPVSGEVSSSSTRQYSRPQRNMQGVGTGTWECRVHRQCDELRQLFELPKSEGPIEDFHCALQKKICLQGRLHLFQHHVCFYSNLFGFVKKKVIPLQDVTSVSKRKNVGFPNSIEIVWNSKGRDKQEFFTSFLHRREAYRLIMCAWMQSSPLAQQQFSEGTFGSKSSPGSSFSGRHGSIASCASLPNSHSLPQHDLASPAMSSQHSEAQSSGLNGHVGVLHSPAVSSVSAPPNNRLKQHRSASWGPQSGTHLEENLTSPFATAEGQEPQRTIPAFGGPRESDDGATTSGQSGSDEWAAEAGVAPAAPQGMTPLLDSVLHVELQDFCHKFLADGAVFWQEFHESRGDKQISLSSWSRHTALGHVRELRFVSPIKALIGPPQAECHQSQRYRMYRGNHLVLETSQTMPNIPFGDHFTVEIRWDVTQVPGSPSQCRLQSQVLVPFSKSTWWKKAIQKGSIDSSREAHEDWLAKVQATLSAPAHVIAAPHHSNLASLQSVHLSRHTSYCTTSQGEVDELLDQLPKEHRETVAHVINLASQGSLCASSSPRSVKTNTMHDDEGLPAYRQPSRSISRMFKTTRFADSPANQDAPHIALSQSMSGIPTGATAHWMLSRLMHAPGRNALLLSILAVTIITLQIMILLGRSIPNVHLLLPKRAVPLDSQPSSADMSQLFEGFASLRQHVQALAEALAAHGINS